MPLHVRLPGKDIHLQGFGMRGSSGGQQEQQGQEWFHGARQSVGGDGKPRREYACAASIAENGSAMGRRYCGQ
jgi:hypothetical protein